MLSAEILETRPRRFGRWTAATVLVIAIHFGGAAIALYTWPSEIEDEASGAIAIELAPLTATTDATPDDLALGRPAEEATPTPALSLPEKSEEHEAEETPVVDQSPARELEVAVPISKPEEKKPDEKKKEDVKKEKAEESPQPVEQPPVQASAPAQAASQPKTDATPAPAPAASRQGRSTKPSKAQLTWQRALLLRLDRHKRYPSAARRQRQQGIATVQFTIDRQGHVLASRLVGSSGAPLLDAEALDVLSRASPLPPPPYDMGGATVELALPIQFKIKR
jgi:periplasmic protein TonB